LAALVALALPAAGQDAALQIKAQANRLRQSVKDKPVSFPDVPNASAMLNSMLDSSKKSLDAGWLYLSLEQLGQSSEALKGPRAMPDKNDASKSSVAGFEAKWERVSRDVAALDQKARERNWDNVPARSAQSSRPRRRRRCRCRNRARASPRLRLKRPKRLSAEQPLRMSFSPV